LDASQGVSINRDAEPHEELVHDLQGNRDAVHPTRQLDRSSPKSSSSLGRLCEPLVWGQGSRRGRELT
jgi:hypothetical protein